jgi:hypothetical protein
MSRAANSELGPENPAEHHQFPDTRGAFSVAEWCRYRGICPATFYNRLPHGEMPATMKIGRRTIITAEADEEWRVRMERQPVVARSRAGCRERLR